MAFLWLRLPKKRVALAGVIALSICGLQMVQLLKPIPVGSSPYTRWLSIDPFSFLPVIFFILL
ncbi:MAG TPA: hypothetical protein DCL56_14930, partial [Lactobacillus sp.]|nr:hypothetical protein [Lactobacillus sp.]